MSPSRRRPALERRVALSRRVALAPGASDVAYVPRGLLVRGNGTVDRVVEVGNRRVEVSNRAIEEGNLDTVPFDPVGREELGGRDASWVRVSGVPEALTLVAELRAEGVEIQPEHVFFAHCCGCCAGAAHPSVGYEAMEPAPYRANPHRANAYEAGPHRADPHRANPHRANEALMSSAMPAADRMYPVRHLAGSGHPRITVLDTGLAASTAPNQCPPLLAHGPRISGDPDVPDADIRISATELYPADGWLDPVAGHGTFIAGLIEQLAPGCHVEVLHVIEPLGDAREGDVYRRIVEQAARPPDQRPQILSMSFGGSVLESAPALRSAVAQARAAGIVVVASAGNDGSPVPQYPAAFDQVLAVGAIGPYGPAPWTNYGEWVDACAPGVDLVSAFFAAFDGPEPMINGFDADDFAEWATWSGTSFAAPVVVAALAREMVLGGCDAEAAVERVVRAPHLLRIPCLGTVVNI